jgi:Ca2+-transporting ATPase
LFRIGFTSNLPLLGAVLLTVGLQLATLYVPALQRVFRTQPLTVPELGLCLGLSATIFVAVEVEKWLGRIRATAKSSRRQGHVLSGDRR